MTALPGEKYSAASETEPRDETAPASAFDTRARARALAEAAAGFPDLGPLKAGDLLDLITAELGHPEILEGFQDHACIKARALAPDCILHILAGNTPLAGLQSLIRGVLLGASNLVKIPSTGLPEIGEFVGFLPEALQASIRVSTELSEEWLQSADALIVFGDDDTVAHFHQRKRPDQVFVAHGHRISFGVIFAPTRDEPSTRDVAALAARDAGLHDQLGCLSPHNFYVEQTAKNPRAARDFAEQLAAAMTDFEISHPRREISLATAAKIRQLRDSYRFRNAGSDDTGLWHSKEGTSWTVIYDNDPEFVVSPLYRTVFVKPLPEGGTAALSSDLGHVLHHLSTITFHPFSEANGRRLSHLPASRLCPLGTAQLPHPVWHHDGEAQLSPLVKWQDLG